MLHHTPQIPLSPTALISRTSKRLMALTHPVAVRQIGLMPVNPHRAENTQIIIIVIIHLISLCLIFLISKMALTTLASRSSLRGSVSQQQPAYFANTEFLQTPLRAVSSSPSLAVRESLPHSGYVTGKVPESS